MNVLLQRRHTDPVLARWLPASHFCHTHAGCHALFNSDSGLAPYKADGKGRYEPIQDYPEGLFAADGVGLGFCLIQREVFEKLPPPYFHYDEATKLGEHLYFSKKAREHFDIQVDGSLKLFHLRTEAFGEGHFKTARHLIQSGQIPDTPSP